MTDQSVNIVIGGEAGQGLVTVGDFLAKALVRAGYDIVATQDYMSRIRGGHNTYAIRTSHEAVYAPTEAIDLLVALDATTLALHRDQLSKRAVVLADAGHDIPWPRALAVPFARLCPKPIYENTAALGVLSALLCLDASWLTALITQTFNKKGDQVVAQNLDVFQKARSWTAEQKADFTCIAPATRTEKRIMLSGNEAIALGALAGGVNFCSFYPMSPGTSIALTLIDKGQRMGLVADQAEDEIAAVNMALGAAYAGARPLVPTSGGGFALMVEGISLSGMTETPLTIALAQRPGPATGLPTRTEQADLNLALYAGHGEFPRAIYAPGSIEQCFHLTFRAVDQAEKHQSPTVILTDQFLADSYRSVAPFDLASLPPLTRPDVSTDNPEGYERFALTASGVSPRRLPGFGEHTVVLDSDEHTPDGHITEDLSVRVAMQDKRARKMAGLLADAIPPDRYGPGGAETLLVCWGSTLGACREAAAIRTGEGRPTGVLHFSQVWPLDPERFLNDLKTAGQAVMVEGNHGGQLARLIRQETGFAFGKVITRYDGLPFTAGYVLAGL